MESRRHQPGIWDRVASADHGGWSFSTKNVGKPWQNHGKAIGKWEKWWKIMGKLENHTENMGKPGKMVEHLGKSWANAEKS